ncbi:restriction endonuclease subunit S [Halococcus saccharolyticus]|uniref:restriction endonuclease subunit S n=1 Tax=Halococcus saccharolyticus TaxID=62319 RepID=UPI0009B5A144|nr:restriction endonuclease subunit S [Halococcus saccharolyticus]
MSEEASLDEFAKPQPEDKAEFVETAAGRIPSDWDTKNVESLCELRNGKATDHADEGVKQYPVYGSNGPIGSHSESNFDGGLIFGRVGAVGEVEKAYQPVWVSDNAIQAQPSDDINTDFLFYCLSNRELGALATKTAQPLLNQSTIGNVAAPYPSYKEQRKIATVLYTLDQAIQKTEEIIEQTERVQRGYIRRRVIASDASGERQDGIVGTRRVTIPQHWSVVRLGDVAEIVSGKSFPREFQKGHAGSRAVIKVEDMNLPGNDKSIQEVTNRVTDEVLDELSKNVFPENTVIHPRVGEALLLNKTRITGEDTAFDDNIMGWIPEEINPEYLYYASTLVDFNAVAQTGTVPSINKTMAANFRFPLPPKEEQEEIAEDLSRVDSQVSIYEEEKEQLRRVKQGLMQDLLSGTVRTHEADIDIPEAVLAHG